MAYWLRHFSFGLAEDSMGEDTNFNRMAEFLQKMLEMYGAEVMREIIEEEKRGVIPCFLL